MTELRNEIQIGISNKEKLGDVEIFATGDGVLQAVFTKQFQGTVKLQYQLPSFYDRSDITAVTTDFGTVISVPKYSIGNDDIVVIPVQQHDL